MAIKEQTIEALSLKKLNGVAHTGIQFALANESKSTGLSMRASTIFADIVPSTISELNQIGLYQTNNDNTVERVILQADPMGGTNNSGGYAQTYELSFPLDYSGKLGESVRGKKLHESSGRLQMIPATFSPVDPANGLSPYKARLYSNTPSTTTLINDASDIREFIIDYFNGTVFLDNPQASSSQTAVKFVEAFVYVGKFLNDLSKETNNSNSQVFNAVASGDETNTTYTLPDLFMPNSTRVYVNGLRMLIGETNDYKELQENKIQFNYPLDDEDKVLVDYLK
jgi:hypothetical protein